MSTITVGSASYTNAYALDTDVDVIANAENLYVVMGNVVQEPDVAYLIHENASSQPRIIQFTGAVASTEQIYVVHRGIGSMSMKPPTGSVGADQLATNLKSFTTDVFTGNGSTTNIHFDRDTTKRKLSFSFRGWYLYRTSTNYSISGTSLTFTSAPDNGAEIEVENIWVFVEWFAEGTDFQYDAFTGNGSATTFNLSSINNNK